MEVLATAFVARLLAISGLGGLVAGLFLPKLGAAVGVGVFIGALAPFALAATSGIPVPMAGWMTAVVIGALTGALGWWIKRRRRA
jgi:hypothetical protein